jgi:hypothetical protein
MAITPRHIPHLGTLAVALLCTCASSGCRTLTIPWEHPAVFKKTPVCDSAGACNQGCYVPPPPVMNSDCYGYRFTCWHPWPEHCQPQCNDGCESTPVHIAPTPAESPPMSSQPSPTMPPASPPVITPDTTPVEPMTPMETMPETSPAAPQSSYPSYSDRHTTMRNAAPSYRSSYETNSRGTAQPSATTTSNYSAPATPDYRYLSAVANSPADRDASTYTSSGARSVDREVGAETRSSNPSATSQHAVERFRW